LLLVMIDETTEETDNRIAQHIIRLHRYQGDAFSSVHYSTQQLQRCLGVDVERLAALICCPQWCITALHPPCGCSSCVFSP
jgi:DNA replicative helicase MCM subunit Mcm2 (Cdc46/Mcm family)